MDVSLRFPIVQEEGRQAAMLVRERGCKVGNKRGPVLRPIVWLYAQAICSHAAGTRGASYYCPKTSYPEVVGTVDWVKLR